MLSDEKLAKARDLVAFINASPTPFHAVAEAARRLHATGFTEYAEGEEWHIIPGTRGYVVRDGTIIAFAAGQESPARAGFTVLGAHTDSPNLKLKPVCDLTNAGFRQLSIEVYGGVLFSTWLDRDLAIAGRIITRDGRAVLVQSARPACRIPNLAIHLNRDVNSAGLLLNAQTHLVPTFGLEHKDAPGGVFDVLAADPTLSAELPDPKSIAGFDLSLYDTQLGCLGGPNDEFIFSARLDNLASCHAAIDAMIEAGATANRTRVVVLYDHEEVGSQSASGARSLVLHHVLERINAAYGERGVQSFARACARSLLVSADMAHALHPNYGERHDKNHSVKLGGGAVIKSNASQAYATDGVTAALFRSACEEAGFAPQYFVSRNDMPCGSTIGPISAARLGMRAVDVGNPMLSMHSCREMAATADVLPMIVALTTILRDEQRLDAALGGRGSQPY
jgi:aspartyl aminopeptidase